MTTGTGTGARASIAVGPSPICEDFLQTATAEGVLALDPHRIRPIYKAFMPMVMEQAFDMSELAMVTAIQAVDHGKPVVPLPITVAARFQHRCIVQNAERTDLSPADLKGRRVAVRAYSQTTGAWVRTILETEYGVPAGSIEWVTQEPPHVREAREPANVVRDPDGAPLEDMLREGRVDAAIFGFNLPDEAWVKPVIPDPDTVARATYDRAGVVPINHIIAVTRDFARRHPEAVRHVYRCFGESKARVAGTSTPDFLPFGLEAMRPSIEALLRSARTQDLIERPLDVDHIFGEAARILAAD